ncbi:MAG TPA: hypothetical protein VGQ99_22315 [Tepidisphaeraceae bacterium]|jgi:hypothetical protein|nr:hypothetical protein [Tepidisphaeraceae bacterium]
MCETIGKAKAGAPVMESLEGRSLMSGTGAIDAVMADWTGTDLAVSGETQVESGAGTLQGWLLTAKQQALRDKY